MERDTRLLVALALQRATFLRACERLIVWDLVATADRLASLDGAGVSAIIGRRIDDGKWRPASFLLDAQKDLATLDRIGARFIHFDDSDYPPLLRETAKPPFGLYARGASLRSDLPAAAIVGTRAPTSKGLDVSYGLAAGLAEAGVPVISGMARGIDAAAHRGAISGRGITCAILPCGIDMVYPPANRGLAASMLDGGGLLLSEYPPGVGLRTYHFPERNRIIAGIARATIVVEAPAKSGALITVDHALSEGRDVWVSGATLGGPRSAGCDALAAEGAPALASSAQLLEDWGWSGVKPERRAGSGRPKAPPTQRAGHR